MRGLIAPVAACCLLTVAACTDATSVAPLSSPKALATKTAVEPTGPWAKIVEGSTGPGSLYGIYVPNNWNGDVIYFVHGIRPPTEPVSLPDDPTDWDGFILIRDQFGAMGFAVAYSSFSENGLALKDAAQRTHQLRGLVASVLNGQPNRSFIVGYSLGAASALQLIETQSAQYDGAVMACGMLGGTPMQFQYIGDVRALFDFYYPGVLPGSTMEMPVVITDVASQIQGPVVGAVLANPTGFGLIAASNQVQLAGNNNLELLTSLVNALAYQAIGVNDLLARTHGHTLFDNTTTVYNSALYPDIFYASANAGVRRYTATSDALEWLEHNYEPTGDLRIPMITFHKTRDRLVPYRHEAAYQARVAAAGESANLLQRSQNAFGHCDFGVQDVMSNFNDLVNWVSTGVRP